jgi:hypothetical protein
MKPSLCARLASLLAASRSCPTSIHAVIRVGARDVYRLSLIAHRSKRSIGSGGLVAHRPLSSIASTMVEAGIRRRCERATCPRRSLQHGDGRESCRIITTPRSVATVVQSSGSVPYRPRQPTVRPSDFGARMRFVSVPADWSHGRAFHQRHRWNDSSSSWRRRPVGSKRSVSRVIAETTCLIAD